MDRTDIRKASRLLAKAESTESDAEAFSLALRSYSLIANALNAYDLEQGELEGGSRRRERRLLRDRRALRRPPEVDPSAPKEETPAETGYKRQSGGESGTRRINLPM